MEGKRSASLSECFTPRKEHPVPHLVGDWEASADRIFWKGEKNLFAQPGVEPRLQFVQSVTKSLY